MVWRRGAVVVYSDCTLSELSRVITRKKALNEGQLHTIMLEFQ